MFSKILNLFPQHRAALAELELAGAARLKAEDESRDAKARAQAAEQVRDATLAKYERALHQVCNFQAMMAGASVVPFPDAYIPPAPGPEPEPGTPLSPGSLRRQARDIEREHNRQARVKAFDDYMKLKNPNGSQQAQQ